MRRRDVLAGIGLTALTGCLGSGSGDGADGTTTTTRTPTTAEPTTTTPVDETDWGVDLAVLDVSCGSEDAGAATITFADAGPEVTGTIVGSNLCYIARLDRVAYDEMEGRLVVYVDSVSAADPDTACAECIAAIDYRVRTEFTGQGPTAVEVIHVSGDREQTVASATR